MTHPRDVEGFIPIEAWDAQRRANLSTNPKDIRQQRFGRLRALSPVARDRWGNIIWLCACDCGQGSRVTAANLRSGTVKSCGCSHRKLEAAP